MTKEQEKKENLLLLAFQHRQLLEEKRSVCVATAKASFVAGIRFRMFVSFEKEMTNDPRFVKTWAPLF